MKSLASVLCSSFLSLVAVLSISSTASARNFARSSFQMTVQYSNATTEVFNQTVLTLRGQVMASDDAAYCQMKIRAASGAEIEIPCQGVSQAQGSIVVIPVARVRSIAENIYNGLNQNQNRALEILEIDSAARNISLIYIPLVKNDITRYHVPARSQFHDPRSNFESSHLLMPLLIQPAR